MTLQGSIKKYLCDNKDLFPLYDAQENCDCWDKNKNITGRGINVIVTPKMRRKI